MRRIRIYLKRVFLLMTVAVGFLSCDRSYSDECGVQAVLRFQYTYNMQQADGLERQASRLRLWIFDAANRLVEELRVPDVDFTDKYNLHLPILSNGKYTLVAVAAEDRNTGEYSDFCLPPLEKGSLLDSLNFRLKKSKEGVNACHLNHFFCGCLETQITGRKQQLLMEMKKMTNTFRILVVPTESQGILTTDEFDIAITDKNGWLTYDGQLYKEDAVIYQPFYKETCVASVEDFDSFHFLVAELSTSRLIKDLHPRLTIRNSRNQQNLLDIDLLWLLSQLAVREHQCEWTAQEYLDRQDEFVITFFLCDNTWMKTDIVVNGWRLSMRDIGLHP